MYFYIIYFYIIYAFLHSTFIYFCILCPYVNKVAVLTALNAGLVKQDLYRYSCAAVDTTIANDLRLIASDVDHAPSDYLLFRMERVVDELVISSVLIWIYQIYRCISIN